MFVRHNTFWIIWTIIILFLSLTPGNEVPEFSWKIVPFDLVVHLAVYAVLAHAMLVGFNKQSDFTFLKKNSLLIAILGSLLIGFALEILQIYIEGRFFDWKDIIANTIGVLIGASVFKLIYYKIV